MGGVLAGFATIWAVIGVGFLCAHIGLLDLSAQVLLSRVAFYVASPALLLMMLSRADLQRVFAHSLIASLGAVAGAALVSLLAWRLLYRREGTESVIAMFGGSYVNAGNLGLPIAAYVLGDVTWMAPILLLQVALLQPAGLTALDIMTRGREERRSLVHNLTLPFRNPMTVATLTGLVVNLLGLDVPRVLAQPLDLIGAMAVPGMLVAFGIALRLGPLPGRGQPVAQLVSLSLVKLVLQPVLAYALGRLVGLDPAALLAVCVIAALPTAQNVFVIASRYRRGVVLARDVIFVTTIGSVPVVIAIAALLR